MSDYCRLRDAVEAYCAEYHIARYFRISELLDIKDPMWNAPAWPLGEDALCYAIFSESEKLLYIGQGTKDEARKWGNAHDGHGPTASPRYVQTIAVHDPHEHLSLERFLIRYFECEND